MKTTNEILFELETLSENFSYNWENKNNFWKYEKKEWVSREEINEAISEVKKWEHHDLSKDWEIELVNKLFNAPDLNSRSSDEDSLNKGYEVNQK